MDNIKIHWRRVFYNSLQYWWCSFNFLKIHFIADNVIGAKMKKSYALFNVDHCKLCQWKNRWAIYYYCHFQHFSSSCCNKKTTCCFSHLKKFIMFSIAYLFGFACVVLLILAVRSLWLYLCLYFFNS